MANEHFDRLRELRDELVDERRQMVAEAFVDPEMRREAVSEFIGLQHLIDTVERAMAHEAGLAGPGGIAGDSMPPPKLAGPGQASRRKGPAFRTRGRSNG